MKKKWIGITLALLVVVVAAVAIVVLGDTKVDAAAPVQLSIREGKTEFLVGESFTIDYSGLPESMKDDTEAEVRIYSMGTYLNGFSGTMPKGCKGGSSTAYLDLCVYNGTNIYSESGSRTFPDHSNKGVGYSLPAGQYRIVLTNSKVEEVSNVLVITVHDIKIETASGKNKFVVGEDIAIKYTGLSESFKGSDYEIEVRFDAGHNLTADPSNVNRSGIGGTEYIDLTLDAAAGGAKIWFGTSAEVSYQKNGQMYRQSNKILPIGDYTVTIFQYSPTRSVISNAIEISIVPEAEPTLSLSKDTYYYGEDIVLTYSNVTEAVKTGYKTGSYMEIDIFKEGHVVGQNSSQAGYIIWHKTPTVTQAGFQTSNEETTIRYPEADTDRNGKYLPLEPGNYYACLRSDNTVVGEVVEFTVVYPVIETVKSEYAFGESIEVRYSGIYSDHIKSGYELRLYPDEYVIGKTQSCAYAFMAVATDDGYTLPHGNSGTISFPENDDRDPKKFNIYPAGTYHLVLTDSNGKVRANVATFTVGKLSTAVQPELKNSVAMHYTVEFSDDLTGAVSMEFTFNGDVFNVDGVPVTASNDGLAAYRFTFDNILPQQMGDSIAAKLFVDGELIYTYDDYSLLTYAQNKLASEKVEDVAAHDVIIAMLNYGAEAQKNFGYKADALVNAGLSDDQKQLADISNVDGVDVLLAGDAVDGYVWKAATLDLQSTLGFRFKFEAEDISKVVFTDGVNSWNFQDNNDLFKSSGNTYWFYYKNIMAHQFADEITITMYVDGVAAQAVTYSVNTYISYIGSKADSNVKDICSALYAYGNAAKAYNA